MKKKKFINVYEQKKEATRLKEDFEEFHFPFGRMLHEAVISLDRNFRSYFTHRKNGDRKANKPRFRSRLKFFNHCFEQKYVLIKNNRFVFKFGRNSNQEYIQLKMTESPPDSYRSVNIIHNSKGFYACFFYDKPTSDKEKNQEVFSSDMGIKRFISSVSTTGKVYLSGSISKTTKFYDRKLDNIRSLRSSCTKFSRRWRKLTGAYQRVSEKKTNVVNDFLHKESFKLTHQFVESTIVVGDLKPYVWKKSRKKGLNRSVQNNWYISRFYGMMEYKSKLMGKNFVRINEAYTSKACSSCGKIHDMPLWRRMMNCECGNNQDRDINSAINILNRFQAQQVPA